MASQLVVDHTELDHDGFRTPCAINGAHPVNELTMQIESLDRRATSRDQLALTLEESTDGQEKYMLSLESRELRIQSKSLTRQRELLIGEAFSESR